MRHQILALTSSASVDVQQALPSCNMPSNLNAPSLCAVTLAALLLCAHGASIGNAPAEDESSGEQIDRAEQGQLGGQRDTDKQAQMELFTSAVMSVGHSRKDFESEFRNGPPYSSLNNCEGVSVKAKCNLSNFSKEACLQTLAEGLQTYLVLLRFVEGEYPIAERVFKTEAAMKILKKQMKNPQQVTALTSSTEEELLRKVNGSKDPFNRKMMAHCIQRELHDYLKECKRIIFNRRTSGRNT